GRPLRLVTSERQLVAGRIADISLGGVRVYAQQPIRHRARACEIRLQDRAIPVRQVRVAAGPDCLAYGLAFEDLSPRDREFLQGFIGQAGRTA
ncbi:MAG TPA: PilZ domain-containing protein, partial [Candidatus Nitrosotenuis sp.]|nr:PilZ domain-containing protein [Candidatus Nitrosotenuis sp.]